MNAGNSDFSYYLLYGFMFQRIKTASTNGKMDATIIQNAEEQRKKAVGIAIKAVEGEEVEDRYEVPLDLIK